MDDLSTFFKKGLKNIHQKALDKEYKLKTIRDRRDDFTCNRRKTRETLMLQKRNIDLNNFSPIFTPEHNRKDNVLKKTVAPPDSSKGVVQNSKRLEMLKKWKEEKEKKKMEEKKNAKPQFKVFHVPVTMGLPDLENVNKVIKGKLIKKQESFRSNFAPNNHTFKPPKNIVPLPLRTAKIKKTNLKTTSNYSFDKTLDIKDKLRKEESKKDGSMVTRSQSISKINSIKKKVAIEKNNASQPLKKTTHHGVVSDNEVVMNDSVKKKNKNGKKGVMWNTVEILDSDDEILTQEIKTKAQKKTYNKTPVKKRMQNGSVNNHSINNDGQASSTTNELKEKMKRSLSLETIGAPINKTPVKPASSRTRRGIRTPKTKNQVNESSDDDTISYSKKITASPSFDNKIDKESNNSYSEDDNFITCRSLKPQKSPRNKSQDGQIENNRHKERSVLYSDEEMTLKTPVKTRKPTTPTFDNKTSTPKNNIHKEPPIYVSPFVTISRGKDSARKEYKMRLSTGGTVPKSPEFGFIVTKNTSPSAAAAYFTKKLDNEICRIEEMCSKWLLIKEEIPEEGQDLVDAAIGQSKLLISKKFQQFRKLITMCGETTNMEQSVKCTDLHGYWDTMYMQVEDIDKRFNNLENLKDNGWEELFMPDKKVIKKRPRGRPKKVEAQSRIKDMIKNSRMCKKNGDLGSGTKELSSDRPTEQTSSIKKRRSLLETTFSNQQSKKLSCSPGMAMLKISQAIKCGDGLTPSKSILKTEGNRSEKRATKSVNFKDLENKENSFENLINFSPVTPRRSRRLSRGFITS